MYSGEPIPRVDAPWLAILPLTAALVALALAARGGASSRGRAWAAVGWAPAAAALGALALTPTSGYLHAHLVNLARLGFVDLRLDLIVDRSTALTCVFAAALVPLFGSTARRHAGLALALAAIAVDDRLLASALFFALVALFVRRPWVRAMSVLTVASTALLFWGLGGAYTHEGYAPEMGPRVVALVSGEPAKVVPSAFDDDDDDDEALPQYAPGDRGSLTVRALPGATVQVDGARTLFGERTPLVSPFEGKLLPVGYHGFRLHPGGASDDYLVEQLRLDPGQRVTLVTAGSTTSIADARDALQARSGERAPIAEALHSRRALGTNLLALASVLLLLGLVGAPFDPLLAVTALGLLAPSLTVLGPSPDAALVALGLATFVGAFGGRADVLLGLAAAFAGAPIPAALALMLSAWLPDRRLAALATLVPRAALAFACAGNGRFGALALVVLATWGALTAARPRTGPMVPKWYVATALVFGLSGLVLFSGRPSIAAFAIALGASIAGWAKPSATATRRRRLVSGGLRSVRRALAAAGGVLGALERSGSGR